MDDTESNSNDVVEPNETPKEPDLPGCGPGGRLFESRRRKRTKKKKKARPHALLGDREQVMTGIGCRKVDDEGEYDVSKPVSAGQQDRG